MSNNLKLCVLSVSCNKQIFEYQEMVARNTWIKHLKEENIDVYIVKASNKNYIDNDIIYCDVEDDIFHTFEKLVEALKQLKEYDYVIKMNVTTYVNAKLLKIYCQYMQDNNIDIGCGCLYIKDNKYIGYRGNGFIMNNKIYNLLKNDNYENKDKLPDDLVFPEYFKNIKGLKIHSTPLRYYCKEGHYIKHPQAIHKVNEKTLEGVVFITYRIIIDVNKSSDPDRSYDNMRYVELGRCYEIDSYYNKLNNKNLSNNFNLIFCPNAHKKFIKGSTIVQK